ncbi:MAG: hypothetical protein ABI846_09985, partial [Rudaea sp.]
RRNSVKAYWNQQKGYGKAEALLENKWPEKYNVFGHTEWKGGIYGKGLTLPFKVKRGKIFYGVWGTSDPPPRRGKSENRRTSAPMARRRTSSRRHAHGCRGPRCGVRA